MAAVDVEALYRQYGRVLLALFETKLQSSTAEEAVDDTFAEFYLQRDSFAGLSQEKLGEAVLLAAFRELARRLDDPPIEEWPIDTALLQQALTAPDAEGWSSFFGEGLEHAFDIPPEDPEKALTEAILASGRVSPSERELLVDARDDDCELLGSFLSKADYAATFGVSLGQLLTPFSQGTVFDPQRAPMKSDGLEEVEMSVRAVNLDLLRLLATSPQRLHDLTPRQFEEVVAELFAKQGYEVNLTASSHDGGADLFVVDNRSIGSFLCGRVQEAPPRPTGRSRDGEESFRRRPVSPSERRYLGDDLLLHR
ncbi:MAG TPA: restriction endonuclease [Solirubrobacterales bacterium]|nr:restriction endonuclease [Solirubrobacterales bacterium]